MTRASWALWILCIAIYATLTPEPQAGAGPVAAAAGESAGPEQTKPDPTRSPAGREIARLRGEVEGERLERLNAALFFLVRHYDADALYAMLKNASPDWIIARGEVERHLHRLERARTALRLYYRDEAAMKAAIEGMSESEIIEHAESLD